MVTKSTFGSRWAAPLSFLSVMRLATLEQSTGILVRWRPFHLLIILQEMKHVPFADKPAKSAYMWRDVERRAAMYGLSVTLPALERRRGSMDRLVSVWNGIE